MGEPLRSCREGGRLVEPGIPRALVVLEAAQCDVPAEGRGLPLDGVQQCPCHLSPGLGHLDGTGHREATRQPGLGRVHHAFHVRECVLPVAGNREVAEDGMSPQLLQERNPIPVADEAHHVEPVRDQLSYQGRPHEASGPGHKDGSGRHAGRGDIVHLSLAPRSACGSVRAWGSWEERGPRPGKDSPIVAGSSSIRPALFVAAQRECLGVPGKYAPGALPDRGNL